MLRLAGAVICLEDRIIMPRDAAAGQSVMAHERSDERPDPSAAGAPGTAAPALPEPSIAIDGPPLLAYDSSATRSRLRNSDRVLS
jgi:hypothetical protein